MLLVSANRFGEFGEGYLYVEYPSIAERKYPVIKNHLNEDHMQFTISKEMQHKAGQKRTNHCSQSSQPMTSRLNRQSANNITTYLSNHINIWFRVGATLIFQVSIRDNKFL